MAKDSELVDYLDDLLMPEASSEKAADHNDESVKPETSEAENTDYKIYTFPSPLTPQKQHTIISEEAPLSGERHNIERMERLLEDFNRRQHDDHSKLGPVVSNDIEHALAETNLERPSSQLSSSSQNTEIRYIDGVLQPEWAENQFEVVIVEAAGLRIALPVFSLGAIHSLEDITVDSAKKPMDSTLFLGTAEINHLHYPVIDCCRWMMPEQYSEIAEAGLDYSYFLTHTKSHYALAVNAVHTSINLTKSDVKWRKARSKRPWMAGMLKEQRAILVELDSLISHIGEAIA